MFRYKTTMTDTTDDILEIPEVKLSQGLGLGGLLISYSLSWYSFVLITANSDKEANNYGFVRPTTAQWIGIVPALVMATLAFFNFLFVVRGSNACN
tara:strand:- start:6950 stop:7237 length:288 start_codon:yes stop_codon:yes gene_type:complete